MTLLSGGPVPIKLLHMDPALEHGVWLCRGAVAFGNLTWGNETVMNFLKKGWFHYWVPFRRHVKYQVLSWHMTSTADSLSECGPHLTRSALTACMCQGPAAESVSCSNRRGNDKLGCTLAPMSSEHGVCQGHCNWEHQLEAARRTTVFS